MGLILSSDKFEIFSLMFIEKIPGINFCRQSECHCQSQNFAFGRNLAVMKHESENRAHIMMKNTRNTYVFAFC